MSTLVSPSLQDLIQAIRDLLNQPDPTNSFWNDEELTRYLNESIRIHMAELADIDEGSFTATTSLDIVQNTELVALPSDFFMAKSIYRVLSDRNVPMVYSNNINSSYSTQNSGSGDFYVPEYGFRGNSIVLRPPPSASIAGGILLEYMQWPAMLSDSADQLSAQINAVFRQSVEMYGVYKAKLKESLANNIRVHDVAMENWQGLFKQFKELSAKRSRRSTSIIPFDA